MRILLAAIGRLKDSGERDLFDRYALRFNQAGRGVSLGPLSVTELPESRALDAVSRKADEGARLLKAVSTATLLVALDENGRLESSVAFAQRLSAQRNGGIPALGLLIGGPDGHSPDVLARAHLTLSLGPMTLPHGLARVFLAEQLYRAVTILSGHPYHRS